MWQFSSRVPDKDDVRSYSPPRVVDRKHTFHLGFLLSKPCGQFPLQDMPCISSVCELLQFLYQQIYELLMGNPDGSSFRNGIWSLRWQLPMRTLRSHALLRFSLDSPVRSMAKSDLLSLDISLALFQQYPRFSTILNLHVESTSKTSLSMYG